MKKLIFIILCMFTMCATIACADNEKPIQVDQLPVNAQQFIKKHFGDRKVAIVKMETELMSKSYEVIFSNGDNIDFDGDGAWKEVNCKLSSVPTAIIPAQIMAYIQKNYPGETVKKIEKDRREYEVKLSNRVELSFDLKFNLIDVDL